MTRKFLLNIKNKIFIDTFTPWILLLLCLLAYGLFSTRIGYFMDDWYLIWFKHTFGAVDYIQYFKSDRPLMGYYFIVANFIMGGSENPIVWQLFAVFTRWLVALSLWQMLNTIWPNAKKQNIWVALLASVFPGFTQQWIAFVYSFFFACLAGFFFSITLMIKAIRNQKRFRLYFLSSLLIMAYVIPASEFFFGLELIRGLILWFEFNSEKYLIKQKITKTISFWFPFVLIYILFLLWRVFFFSSANHSLKLKQIFTGEITQIFTKIVARIYQAIIDSTANSWVNPLNLNNYPKTGTVSLIIQILVFLSFILLVFWQNKSFTQFGDGDQNHITTWRKQAPILSLFSLIVAIIPFLSADLQINYLYPNDRFLLSYLMGSCLLLVWVIEAIGHNEWKTIIIVSLFVSIAMGYQIANGNKYKNLWATQKAFIWQIYWRMPEIKQNTTLIAYQLPDKEYWTGNSLSAELNWIYSSAIKNRELDYLFLLFNSGQNSLLPDFQANRPIQYTFRTYSFKGNTSQSIFVYYTTDGCMRVLDSKITRPDTVIDIMVDPNLQLQDPRIQFTQSGAALTNLDLISSNNFLNNMFPTNILGKEPAHDWCYFFEKADLAYQNKNYNNIVLLYNAAIQKGLSSPVGSEYYPFIDALGHTGKLDTAMNLTLQWQPISSSALERGLCSIWQRLSKIYPTETIPEKVILSLKCQNSLK